MRYWTTLRSSNDNMCREDWLRRELDAGQDWSYDGYLLWLCLSLGAMA